MKNKKKKDFLKVNLGDLTCKSYGNFMFLKIDDVLRYIKREYYQYEFVEFDFQDSHYILELRYRLTEQKTIEISRFE